jgi:putative phosphoesterase
LLADTHGYLDPRIAAEVRNCDLAVHAGDIGGEAVYEALEPRSGIVVAVLGNNDTPGPWRDWEQSAARPGKIAIVDLPGGALVVVHGDRHVPARRRHALLRRHFATARAVVYGHSHHLVCDTDVLPWILNPGAAGRVRTYGGPSCLILTTTREEWRVETRRFAPAEGPALAH